MTFGRGIGGRLDRRELPQAVAAVSTPLTLIQSVPVSQWVRSDLGVTLGGTLLAQGVTPPVITLTGSFSGTTPAIRIICTLGGTLGNSVIGISYDNGGSFAQQGLTASTVPLTGAGAGVTLNIAAGTATVGDLWFSTVATLADQSGNTRNFTQGTAAAQPTFIANTLNARGIFTFDGVAQFMDSTWARTAPATTNQWISAIIRQNGWTAGHPVLADQTANSFHTLRQAGASPAGTMINPTSVNSNNALAVGTWGRLEALFTGSTSDYLKLLTNKVTGASAGNQAGTGTRMGAGAGIFTSCSIAELVITAGAPSAGEIAALDAYYTSLYGAGLV